MFITKKFIVILPLIFAISACNNNNVSESKLNNNSELNSSSQISNQPFNYQKYDQVLKTYVDDSGLVDYQKLQQNRQLLDEFNTSLGQVSIDTYNSWSEPEKIAFLINAYNSLTLQSIIDQNPLKKSIRDIPGVWRIRKFPVAGQSKTLDEIEHKILRVDFNEPRIHAALVCAAISCPPLRKEAYTGKKLDSQLDQQVEIFLANDQNGFKINRQQNRVYLSSIFKWFGEDWQKSYGIDNKFAGNAKEKAVLNFVSNYLNPEDKSYLETGNYQVDYLDYDWSVNIQNTDS